MALFALKADSRPELDLNGQRLELTAMQHPNAAPGQVLASQEGRGTVYSLRADTGRYAFHLGGEFAK